jgi:hypothetical protein
MDIDIYKTATTIPARIDYVLPGLVAGTVGGLVSPGGSGKSQFALQMCSQIATGKDLLGFGNFPTGKALYLPAEDPVSILEHRIFAVGELLSDDEKHTWSENLYIKSMLEHDPNILDDRWYSWLSQVSEDMRLVVLDTLIMFHKGNENDAGEMAEVMGRIKRICASTGTTIIFLHHTNKGAGLNGLGAEQAASRGSSVLVDNIRWQRNLTTMSEREAETFGVDENCRRSFVKFHDSKQNYTKAGTGTWFRIHSAMEKQVDGGFTLRPAQLGKPNDRKFQGKGAGNGRNEI